MTANRHLHLKIRKLKRRDAVALPGLGAEQEKEAVQPRPNKPRIHTFSTLYGQSDLELVCEENVVEAHQAVVGRASTFIRDLLLHRDRDQVCIILPGVSTHDLENLCSLLYLGQISVGTFEALKGLKKLWKSLQIDVISLKDLVIDIVSRGHNVYDSSANSVGSQTAESPSTPTSNCVPDNAPHDNITECNKNYGPSPVRRTFVPSWKRRRRSSLQNKNHKGSHGKSFNEIAKKIERRFLKSLKTFVLKRNFPLNSKCSKNSSPLLDQRLQSPMPSSLTEAPPMHSPPTHSPSLDSLELHSPPPTSPLLHSSPLLLPLSPCPLVESDKETSVSPEDNHKSKTDDRSTHDDPSHLPLSIGDDETAQAVSQIIEETYTNVLIENSCPTELCSSQERFRDALPTNSRVDVLVGRSKHMVTNKSPQSPDDNNGTSRVDESRTHVVKSKLRPVSDGIDRIECVDRAQLDNNQELSRFASNRDKFNEKETNGHSLVKGELRGEWPTNGQIDQCTPASSGVQKGQVDLERTKSVSAVGMPTEHLALTKNDRLANAGSSLTDGSDLTAAEGQTEIESSVGQNVSGLNTPPPVGDVEEQGAAHRNMPRLCTTALGREQGAVDSILSLNGTVAPVCEVRTTSISESIGQHADTAKKSTLPSAGAEQIPETLMGDGGGQAVAFVLELVAGSQETYQLVPAVGQRQEQLLQLPTRILHQQEVDGYAFSLLTPASLSGQEAKNGLPTPQLIDKSLDSAAEYQVLPTSDAPTLGSAFSQAQMASAAQTQLSSAVQTQQSSAAPTQLSSVVQTVQSSTDQTQLSSTSPVQLSSAFQTQQSSAAPSQLSSTVQTQHLSAARAQLSLADNHPFPAFLPQPLSQLYLHNLKTNRASAHWIGPEIMEQIEFPAYQTQLSRHAFPETEPDSTIVSPGMNATGPSAQMKIPPAPQQSMPRAQCNVCDKIFGRVPYVKKHLKKVHKFEPKAAAAAVKTGYITLLPALEASEVETADSSGSPLQSGPLHGCNSNASAVVACPFDAISEEASRYNANTLAKDVTADYPELLDILFDVFEDNHAAGMSSLEEDQPCIRGSIDLVDSDGNLVTSTGQVAGPAPAPPAPKRAPTLPWKSISPSRTDSRPPALCHRGHGLKTNAVPAAADRDPPVAHKSTLTLEPAEDGSTSEEEEEDEEWNVCRKYAANSKRATKRRSPVKTEGPASKQSCYDYERESASEEKMDTIGNCDRSDYFKEASLRLRHGIRHHVCVRLTDVVWRQWSRGDRHPRIPGNARLMDNSRILTEIDASNAASAVLSTRASSSIQMPTSDLSRRMGMVSVLLPKLKVIRLPLAQVDVGGSSEDDDESPVSARPPGVVVNTTVLAVEVGESCNLARQILTEVLDSLV